MDMGLKDKVAVITGGGSGLGRETAHYFVREGARVVLADINADGLDTVERELTDLGGEAAAVSVDVTRYADCELMTDLALKTFGQIDILVAGAGITGGMPLFLDSKPEDWEAVINVNIKGVMNANRAIAPVMVEAARGSIVNIGSEAGKVGEKRMVTYSATKGAVIAFSKALSVELGRFGVRVNAVCPGVTDTPMIAALDEETRKKSAKFYPLGRLGRPDDVAAAITYLASDQADWVTGQALSINGGFGRS